MGSGVVAQVCAELRRARARAEFAEWAFFLGRHESQVARIDRTNDNLLSKELARGEVVLDLAQGFGLSEQRTWAIISEASVLRDRTPVVWTAFREGILDAARASAIAETAERLTDPANWATLEHSVVDYATGHTVAELRAWLRRFRHRTEPEPVAIETAKAVDDRRVSVTHNDDGTSWLNALLPTGVAITVADRLRKAARALPKMDPETGERDRRTRDQKQADLLAHWLTSCTGTETDIRAEIAISIPATDLIGYTDGPGFTRDGEPLSAEWVRELATSEHTTFRRLVLDPVGEVLDTTILTYRPPETLRQALHWRDGTCRVAGCRAPVFETDLDHAKDYDSGGPTSGSNLRCLCRKHHNMKSHGHLDDRHLDTPYRHIERYHPCAPITVYCDLWDPLRAA